MKRGFGVLLAVGVLSVGIGACDDDDETTTTTGTTGATGATGAGGGLTKTEFIDAADQICLEVNRQLQDVPERDFAEEGAPLIETTLTSLRALTPPPGDEEEVDEMITAGEEGLDRLAQPGVDEENVFDEFTKLAGDYGLEGGCTGNQGGG
jgi:hypothetical protein